MEATESMVEWSVKTCYEYESGQPGAQRMDLQSKSKIYRALAMLPEGHSSSVSSTTGPRNGGMEYRVRELQLVVWSVPAGCLGYRSRLLGVLFPAGFLLHSIENPLSCLSLSGGVQRSCRSSAA